MNQHFLLLCILYHGMLDVSEHILNSNEVTLHTQEVKYLQS